MHIHPLVSCRGIEDEIAAFCNNLEHETKLNGKNVTMMRVRESEGEKGNSEGEERE